MTANGQFGVAMTGVGSAVPEGVLTNADFEKMVDTTDEWITQRTGIKERRIVDQSKEGVFTLGCEAIQNALQDAHMTASDLDLLIMASVTGEMTCPSTACRIANAIGAGTIPAFDVLAACSGFVYALNLAESLIQSGRYNTVGIIGCDALSTITDYNERAGSILFGDAAGAAILKRDDDPSRGSLFQSMHTDGSMWETLYIPRRDQDVPCWDKDNPIRLGNLRMQGREVFRFAVNKFREVIEEALDETSLTVDDISQFICHQSNLRIIQSAQEKIGLPDDKVYVNIEKYGNSSAGSVGLCLDQLWQAGRIKRGDTIVLVAFGGGLTWASNVWRV